MSKIIGAVTIGQAPRPDLLAPLRELSPDIHIIEAGALDGLTAADLPDPDTARYPLQTRLANGRLVTAAESFIAPRLQQAIGRLEAQGASAILLLCAGLFAGLRSQRLLFNPTTLVSDVLRSAGVQRIGVVSPFAMQKTAAEQKWRSLGFETAVWVAPPENPSHNLLVNGHIHPSLQAIVLDYFGHTTEQVKVAQAAVTLPLFDLGLTAAAAVASVFTD